MQGFLVGCHDLSDAFSAALALGEQFLGGAKGVGHRGFGGLGGGTGAQPALAIELFAQFRAGENEAAAHGVVVLRGTEGNPGGVESRENHAVGVQFQGYGVEVNLVGVVACGAHHGHRLAGGGGGVGRHGHGIVTGEPEDDGTVGAVPAPGGGQRAAQFHPNGGGAQIPEVVDEGLRGAHGAHGMRGGGANADAEEIDNANGHGEPFIIILGIRSPPRRYMVFES
ncbi:hypothetical protein Clow_01996 [Corynebacterium lowii]|uniref:Uncharacterized protein n=1 Tax=Corynebacterium lowii TaxID=1544413 RepID=A0A0Q1AGS6_9CORY|nr:hypothetical protein Clow_01996 [Corynebacterium lowii]